MDPWTNYEHTGFDPTSAAPPPPLPPPPPPYNTDYGHTGHNADTRSVSLTEEDVRDALSQFVNEHCCYGTDPLKEIALRSIEPATTYHYRLDSFMEKRTTSQVEAPYDGSPVDGPACGPPLDMWSVPIRSSKGDFHKGEETVILPHTTCITVCPDCAATGRKPCLQCSGHGKTPCSACATTGYSETRCQTCQGTGDVLCKHCNGVGQKLCTRCQGQCRLKNFTRVKAVFTNYTDDRIVSPERSVPSEEIVKNGAGITVYRDEAPAVPPIVNFPEQRIVHLSRQAVATATTAHRGERLLRQRQVVNAVPVTEVVCTYKNKSATFYVYGLNNRVYFPDYFSQWFGCCTIL